MGESLRDRLLKKLKLAVELSRKCPDNWSEHFSSSKEFYEAMKDAYKKLKDGDNSVVVDFISWFIPSYDWDDFVGDVDLGNDIYDLLIDYSNFIQGKTTRNVAGKDKNEKYDNAS